MTVQQLITLLRTMPRDARVVMNIDMSGDCDIGATEHITGIKDPVVRLITDDFVDLTLTSSGEYPKSMEVINGF